MVLIRKAASREEIKEVAILAERIWREHYIPLIGREQTKYMLKKFQSEDAIAESIQSGMNYYMVFCDNVLCGYAAAKHTVEGNTVFLSKFYVDKLYRGRGLSKKLLDEVCELAKRTHSKSIWLTCNKYNSLSLEIYRKLGFKIVDQMVTDIGNGYVMDDYKLEMRLNQS